MCSLIHYGNINRNTTTYQNICVSVTIYYPTVIALSYQLCHQGNTCELLLTNQIPDVSGHYCHQTHLDSRILNIYIYIYMYMGDKHSLINLQTKCYIYIYILKQDLLNTCKRSKYIYVYIL